MGIGVGSAHCAPLLPCMGHSEPPLFGDITVDEHPAEEPRRVPGGDDGGEPGGGGGSLPRGPVSVMLQQVLPESLHQILVQVRITATASSVSAVHLRDRQGVRAGRRLLRLLLSHVLLSSPHLSSLLLTTPPPYNLLQSLTTPITAIPPLPYPALEREQLTHY